MFVPVVFANSKAKLHQQVVCISAMIPEYLGNYEPGTAGYLLMSDDGLIEQVIAACLP